jgi:hypothetical protein
MVFDKETLYGVEAAGVTSDPSCFVPGGARQAFPDDEKRRGGLLRRRLIISQLVLSIGFPVP